MNKIILLLVSHLGMAVFGFALGIYMLPILTEQPAPSVDTIQSAKRTQEYSTSFVRNLSGSDMFHWGEGTVSVGPAFVVFEGEIAPGPDYRLYLSTERVHDEYDFNLHRDKHTYVGDVKTFGNFIIDIPPNIDINDYNSVIIWCESFGEFITSAEYR